MPSMATSLAKPAMSAATAVKYETLCSRSQLGETELHMRWVESGLEWAEWIDDALAEIDAVEQSIRQADAGLFATQAEIDAAFNKWRR